MLAQGDREPHLVLQITALRDEHTEFRRQLDEVLQGLRRLAHDENERFEGLCHALRNLLARIDAHDAKEVELLEQLLLAKPVRRN